MHFGEYLKICRQRRHLTQQETAELLYAFHPVFEGIDAVTISRWERNVTSPSIERQRYIIEAMQRSEEEIFPCFDSVDMENIERIMAKKGIRRVIGKHKQYILDFPSEIIDRDAVTVTSLSMLENPLPSLKIAHTFMQKITDNAADIDFETYKKWALHPGSIVLLATYYRQFFGIFVSIRLQPTHFESLMRFDIDEKEITTSMLAAPDEEGCEYPITFFAYNDEAAALLSLRYYRTLHARAAHTACAGTFPKHDAGAKIAQTLGLSPYKKDPNSKRYNFRANMGDILLNRYILSILFKHSDPA